MNLIIRVLIGLDHPIDQFVRGIGVEVSYLLLQLTIGQRKWLGKKAFVCSSGNLLDVSPMQSPPRQPFKMLGAESGLRANQFGTAAG